MKSYLPLPVSMTCCICNYFFHYSSMKSVERRHVKTKSYRTRLNTIRKTIMKSYLPLPVSMACCICN